MNEELLDWNPFDDDDGDEVSVGGPNVRFRLRGARLAAGYIVLKDAANLAQTNETTYRFAEYGARTTSPKIVEFAARLFDVSEDYLIDGNIMTEQDALASRLEAILQEVKDENEGAEERLLRLRRIRLNRGIPSAAAAAKEFGWRLSSYSAHELGTRAISIDRMIGYCLAMGARPEFGVLGLEPMMDELPPDWHEQARVDSEEPRRELSR